MLPTTLNIIRESLRGDPSVDPQDRGRLLSMLRNGGLEKPETPSADPVPAIITRSQTAERFNRSLRFIDGLAKSGILSKVRLPGRIRCCGFRAADVAALIAGKGDTPNEHPTSA